METDEQAIVALMDRFMDAWNRHDAKSFASVFAEDGDFTNWRGTGASGRSKIEEFHAPMFTTIFKNSHQTYTPHGHASAWSLIFKDRTLQAHNLAIGTLVAHQQQEAIANWVSTCRDDSESGSNAVEPTARKFSDRIGVFHYLSNHLAFLRLARGSALRREISNVDRW